MKRRDKMITEKTIKYFSMFSGIGGFEYGIEKANTQTDFECVGYSEIDKYAVSIYEKNYPNHINYGDATKINPKDLPDFEFLVGGFPCQAFSIAGKRRGFNEARGTLFFEIARILRDKKPRYFLLENVKGLLSHEGGETLETIFRVCDELGYNVSWAIYNSKNYGVPQNRERVFIKGYFRGKCGREVLCQPGDCTEVDGKLGEWYGVRSGRIHNPDELMNTLSTTGQNCGSSQLIILNNDRKRSQGERVYDVNGVSATLQGNAGGLGGKTGLYKIKKIGNVSTTNYKDDDVLSTDGISKTLTAICHQQKTIQPVLTPDRENKRQNGRRMKNNDEEMFTLTAQDKHGVYDGYSIRKLTPVECERLQGFPDNWTKYGKDDELISDTQRYKCCGNAVTTNVITAIVDEMFKGDDD